MSKTSKKIIDTLVHHLPFLFPKRKIAIRHQLEEVLEKRWKIVSDILGVRIESPPHLEIPFEAIHEASYLKEKKTIRLTSYFSLQNEDELFRTIDHEIAHSIQYEKNTYLRRVKPSSGLIPSDLYWFIKGKMNKTLTEKAFREGFATYVSSITSGNLSSSTQRTTERVESGKRWKVLFQTELLPYALGYIAYYAISKSKSEKFAISVGLYESPSIWLRKGREALARLGKRCII